MKTPPIDRLAVRYFTFQGGLKKSQNFIYIVLIKTKLLLTMLALSVVVVREKAPRLRGF